MPGEYFQLVRQTAHLFGIAAGEPRNRAIPRSGERGVEIDVFLG